MKKIQVLKVVQFRYRKILSTKISALGVVGAEKLAALGAKFVEIGLIC